MLESEEEVGEVPHVVRVEMCDEKVAEGVPGQSETSHGPDGSRATIKEEVEPLSLEPMRGASSGRIRIEGTGSQDKDPHGQKTTLRTSTTPPACRRRR
jgi:hypothetical protein